MSTFNRSPAHALARSLIPLTAAVIVASAAAPLRAAQLIAPDASVAGFSQGQLTGMFVQWLLTYPAPINPLFVPTGGTSTQGDQGSYFFLAGSDNQGPVERYVTVRSDQTVLLDLVTATSGGPTGVFTEAELRADAAYAIGIPSNLSVTVDGAAALMPSGFSSLEQFRHSSPLYSITFIADNIFGAPPGETDDAVTDGFLVALEGLPIGTHELHFTSFVRATGPYEGVTFAQDITYHLTSVVPEASTWAMMGLGLAAISAGAIRRRRMR